MEERILMQYKNDVIESTSEKVVRTIFNKQKYWKYKDSFFLWPVYNVQK